MKLPKKPFYHFSIDDSFDALIEISDKNLPILKHTYFKYLYNLHIKYGLTPSLYLFFQKEFKGRLRTLKEVRNIKKELLDEKGKPWMLFGPHSLDFDTAPYSQSPKHQEKVFTSIYKEIDRFAGKPAHSKFVRLHYYSESYELADFFRKKGTDYLFTTDREVKSYRMGSAVERKLKATSTAQYKKMNFVSTHHRLEFFREEGWKFEEIRKIFNQTLKKFGFIVFYTHECEFKIPRTKVLLNSSLNILKDMGVKPVNF